MTSSPLLYVCGFKPAFVRANSYRGREGTCPNAECCWYSKLGIEGPHGKMREAGGRVEGHDIKGKLGLGLN